MSESYARLLELLRGRRSIRRFRPEPVPAELVSKLAEAARWAPSAGNRQAWRLLAVSAPGRRAALRAAVDEALAPFRAGLRPEAAEDANRYLDAFCFFDQAPLVLAFAHRPGPDLLAASQQRRARPAGSPAGRQAEDSLASVAAAVENLLLAAHALGLGACWMTGPLVAAPALGRLLGLQDSWEVAALVPVGYPAEAPAAPPRRAAERLLRVLDAGDDGEDGPREGG
ncbi:MAG TPA: nitroreductase family protein [Myxococcota bacterium]|nr:nitroreductase family protein [Myxococcota bacterium]HRY95802.1 nitroreductase family protein [Myxococcota bacterium]HSA23407.1 nitroreductase family protein [Myxococcota bacterium]